jgi:proteasome lid subunit RPN8/RPN11
MVNFRRLMTLDTRRRPAPTPPIERLQKQIHVYYLDSLFLQRLQRDLTPFADEEAVLVSGVRYMARDNTIVSVPTSVYMPEYVHQSMTRVTAKPESVRTILDTMENAGQTVVARFHSHPGPGRGMVVPSTIDTADQQHWEESGYATVSGIVSRAAGGTFFMHIFTMVMHASVVVVGRAWHRGRNVWEIPQDTNF